MDLLLARLAGTRQYFSVGSRISFTISTPALQPRLCIINIVHGIINISIHIVTCQAHPALVKWVQQSVRFSIFGSLSLG